MPSPPSVAAAPHRNPRNTPCTVRKRRLKTPPEDKDPSKMTDDELNAALKAARAQVTDALSDSKHSYHKDALPALREMLPRVIVPETVE